MNRFKFRVWHKLENRWLDPWSEEDPMMSMKPFEEGCDIFLYERESKDWSNMNCLGKNIVIQQWTGLKDMDGVDIYEGDILRDKYAEDNETTAVYWTKAYSGYQFCECDPSDAPEPKDFYGGVCAEYKKVVGNIFEGIKE